MSPDQMTRPRTTPSRGQQAARSTRRVASRAADQGQRVAATAIDSGQGVAATARERGQQVAGTAKQDVADLAGTAREQAAEITDELRMQCQQLLDDARAQLALQRDVQTERMAEGLRRFGAEALALAEGRPDEAGTVGEYVQQCADKLDEWADSLETMGIEGVLGEVKTFAQRRPAAFIAGAALAGLGIGRLLRSSSSDTNGPGAVETASEANGTGTERPRRATGSRSRQPIALEAR